MGTSEVTGGSFSRRTFLRLAGPAAVGLGGAAWRGRQAAAQPAVPGVREIELEAREVMWELAPGKRIKAMAYNGQIPGPELRVKEGERVRIVLTNGLAEPTTIHWHGVDVPNAMDGVPGLTEPRVEPGERFVYESGARPAGTRWYHTHFQEHRQLDLGLAAPLVIEPAEPAPHPSDREYTLVLDDWATGLGRPLTPNREGTAGGHGRMGGMMGGMGGMMGRGGMGGMMGSAQTPAYDTMTINGKAHPATEPLHVERGERLRPRLVNASAEHTHVVRLARRPPPPGHAHRREPPRPAGGGGRRAHRPERAVRRPGRGEPPRRLGVPVRPAGARGGRRARRAPGLRVDRPAAPHDRPVD
jgi:multicopper oxidase